MRDFRFVIFLTFVLMFTSGQTWAAPAEDEGPRLRKEPIQTIEDPALTAAALERRTQWPRFAGLSFAWLGGQVTKELNSGSQTGFGLFYSVRDKSEEFWDFQAHWLSSNAAWLQAGKKFLILSDCPYEPYYRLGVSHFVDPEETVAGLFRLDSFKASASVGVLDLFQMGRVLRFEAGAHWGMAGLAFHIQSGLQWNF